MAYQNFFATKLYTDIGAADTTITLETVPTATSGRLVLEARNATQREIIKYTGVAGNTITGVTRGQGGTTAKSHLKNALVEMNATAQDLQDVVDAFNSFAASTNDWRSLVTVPVLTSSSGQREYLLNFLGVDYTGVLSTGMKLKGARVTAAQTQSTSLNGTSQYWSKTTPAGMTFTDDFVCGAWIKLSSYAGAGVISRYNGTSGWSLIVGGSGEVRLRGYNGSAANISEVYTYQSIPLNKWVHISAQLDMSAFTATSTTSYIMIDGIDVPVNVSRSGTNPTSLVQAGNLEIGSQNGGTLPFPGRIQDPFVTSAKLTQAQVRAFKDQKLTTALATTYGMAAAIPFDGNGNDVSTNANNLTGNGGAVATDTDTAFETSMWGIIMKAPTYSGGNTSVTISTPTGAGIPNETLGVFSYASGRTPYGFPANEDRWTHSFIFFTELSHTNPASGNVVQNVLAGMPVYFPTGEWIPGGTVTSYMYRSSAGNQSINTGWSTTNASITNPTGMVNIYLNYSIAGDNILQTVPNSRVLSLSAMTAYYFFISGSSGMTTLSVRGNWTASYGNLPGTMWTFRNAYL